MVQHLENRYYAANKADVVVQLNYIANIQNRCYSVNTRDRCYGAKHTKHMSKCEGYKVFIVIKHSKRDGAKQRKQQTFWSKMP